MVKYLLLDINRELIEFKKSIVMEFGKPLPNSIIEEIVFQVFDVFLTYGIRSKKINSDQDVNRQLQLLPNDERIDLGVFLGQAYLTKRNVLAAHLYVFANTVYERLKTHIQTVYEFNFVVNKLQHENGRILLEYFEF